MTPIRRPAGRLAPWKAASPSLQTQIVGICRDAGIALCGPNCMGVLSPHNCSTTYLQELPSLFAALGKSAVIDDGAFHPALGRRKIGVEDTRVAHAKQRDIRRLRQFSNADCRRRRVGQADNRAKADRLSRPHRLRFWPKERFKLHCLPYLSRITAGCYLVKYALSRRTVWRLTVDPLDPKLSIGVQTIRKKSVARSASSASVISSISRGS
jgi:hypothetical protein